MDMCQIYPHLSYFKWVIQQRYQLLRIYDTGDRRVNIRRWCNDNDSGRRKCTEKKKPAQCHFVHQKFQMDCIEINVNGDQQDATILAYYLFLISSTCFGRCLRPSSGALDCIYSI